MLHSVNECQGYEILATDGKTGTIAELFFDDRNNVIRYLVVNTGGWLHRKQVLISPWAVAAIDRNAKTVRLNLTRDEEPGNGADRHEKNFTRHPRPQPKAADYVPFGTPYPRDDTYYGDPGPKKWRTHSHNSPDSCPTFGSEYGSTECDDFGFRRHAREEPPPSTDEDKGEKDGEKNKSLRRKP